VFSGCATLIHGPYQDVEISSTPPGATATISALASERGPNFLDKEKRTVTTPATVRLQRDNSYRVELEKPGYKLTSTQVVSAYDWLLAPIGCGPCEAYAQLPNVDMKGRALPLRFLEGVFYSYPRGFVRALAYTLRLFSPEALMGTSFKLKPQSGGFFSNWHGMGPARVATTLEATGG
jgi:hypothetical protein